MAKEEKREPKTAGSPTRSYRCVCGELTRFDDDSVTCARCGRHYDYASLTGAMAATAVVYTDDNRSATTESNLEDMDSLIGQRLEHFLILNRLGSGGMGAVYRALDESLQRYVALKVIHRPNPESQDGGLEGIFQEARAQARVSHPNVAHIYYVGTTGQHPFLAMELVGEETLADRMADGPLPFPDVVRYGRQVAEALEHAAAFDIVHGDVKPNNVLLAGEGTVKLVDFGLARRLSQAYDESVAAGTPEFVSPEVTQGLSADHRSDVYSLGVTLFKMTFGRPPYTPSSRNISETLRLHRHARVEFPDPWPADLPTTWRDVLARMLAKNPEDRHQNFGDLLRDLRRHEPISLPTASPLLRGLAWLLDSVVLFLAVAVVSFVFSSEAGYFALLRVTAIASLATAFCVLQAAWSTTPGKRLFQIRIVDQFGLRPNQATLALRAVAQFMLVWGFVTSSLFSSIGATFLGLAVGVAIDLAFLADVLVLFWRRGRSIHDQIFRTRVVLDAAPE